MLFGLLLGLPAHASFPFCVAVQGLPDDCGYIDGLLCEQRAGRLGGACIVNRLAATTPPGSGQFCLVVDGQPTLCIYSDRESCNVDAARHKTACVQAVPNLGSAIDPFAIRRPY